MGIMDLLISHQPNTAIDEYITFNEFVIIALDDPSTAICSIYRMTLTELHKGAQPLFPLIFSIAETLETMLDELRKLFWKGLLFDTSGTKLRFVFDTCHQALHSPQSR